jgi:hypothetical protein
MNAAPAERFFYHSFPRLQKDNPSVLPGLNALSSMLKFGLLLTPEVICWGQPGGERLCFLQKRICFTELAPTDLSNHAEEFGKFALEFSINGLRELGGIPVFYVPSCSDAAKGFHGVGTALVSGLDQVGQLLNRLREHKNGIQGCLSNLPAVQEAINSITGGPRSLEQLCFIPVAIQSLLLPTENPKYTDDLHYYRQREWRIIENFALNDHWPFRDLTQTEKEQLVAQEAFFQRELTYPSLGNPKIVDHCKYYSQLERTPVMGRVRNIIVPSAAVAEAKRLVDDSNLKIPVIASIS